MKCKPFLCWIISLAIGLWKIGNSKTGEPMTHMGHWLLSYHSLFINCAKQIRRPYAPPPIAARFFSIPLLYINAPCCFSLSLFLWFTLHQIQSAKYKAAFPSNYTFKISQYFRLVQLSPTLLLWNQGSFHSPLATFAGYHFWNQPVKIPLPTGSAALTSPVKDAASVPIIS